MFFRLIIDMFCMLFSKSSKFKLPLLSNALIFGLIGISFSSCYHVRDLTSEPKIKAVQGKKLVLQEDVFITESINGRFDYDLNVLIGDSHLPKTIEAYEKYGGEWYKYDSLYQELHKINKHDEPDKVVGILRKGTVITVGRVEVHSAFNYGPFFFMQFQSDDPLFKGKISRLDCLMFDVLPCGNGYEVTFNPKYLKDLN